MGHKELSERVKVLLRDALAARYRGELHAGKARLQSYADGYMRALGDAGLFSQAEMLGLVVEVRAELQAPARSEEPTIAAVG
jgi:hypothetical protein